jgi:hypothetical protein
MPDLPSFPFLIFERIDNGPDGNLVLEVRKMYYLGGREGEVFDIDYLPRPLKQNKNEILSSETARIEKCRVVNDRGYIRAVQKYEEYRDLRRERKDIFTRRLFDYFETVIGRFYKWYDQYGVQRPETETRQLIQWTGNESEFAQLILDTYRQNQGVYKSIADATRKIFVQYEFTDKMFGVCTY